MPKELMKKFKLEALSTGEPALIYAGAYALAFAIVMIAMVISKTM